MKILAISDYGNTGISESVRVPLTHFHESGHEVWQIGLGFNGWTAAVNPDIYPWRDRMLRMIGDPQAARFGEQCLAQAIDLAKPDVVFTGFDVWMVRYLAQPHLHHTIRDDPRAMDRLGLDTRTFKHVAYFPLDGLVQEKYLARGLDETIAGFDVPVTYSRYSQEAVKRAIGVDIPFIPIAHNPKDYHPGNREAARARLNLPQDKFIIGMVAANQYRKLWPEFMAAAGRLCAKYDDIVVIPFTTWGTQILGGFDIADLAWRAGMLENCIDPKDIVGQLNDSQMGDLYRSLDVCVLTTVGEGAGLPPIRARACGVPALVSDNTSNTEFAADPYELVPSKPSYYDNGSGITRYQTNLDVLVQKLEELHNNIEMRHNLGLIGARAMQQYSTPNVLPKWDALLESLA